jgi:two-component system OmpR family response regulator
VKLLLVEDDTALVAQLKPLLQGAGYAVETAGDGEEAAFMGQTPDMDAIILDLGLPKRNGIDVLRDWRQRGIDTPVVILTARDAWHERVDGLKAGADDYVGKPFHPEELLARIEAVIRRRHGHATNIVQIGDLILDGDRQQLCQGERTENLTAIEYRLLRYMMLHPDHVLSKTELSEHIYEDDHLRDSNVIEVYINRLRQRLKPGQIETRRGQGYLLRSQT